VQRSAAIWPWLGPVKRAEILAEIEHHDAGAEDRKTDLTA
jgi:hypothetical protein